MDDKTKHETNKALEVYTGIQSTKHNKHFQLLLPESQPLTSESVITKSLFI